MFKFFSQISDIISTVVKGVATMFRQVVMVFEVIGDALSFAIHFVQYLPTPLILIGGFFISYCVIVNLLNKGG